MKRQTSIQTFFAKRLSVSEPSKVNFAVSNDAAASVVASTSTDPFPVSEESNQTGLLQLRANKYDIVHNCQSNSTQSLTNEEKISLLENVCKPPTGNKFPTISFSNHARSFQMKSVEKFKCLANFEEKSGSFCKYCVIFSHSEIVGKGDHQMSGVLARQAFTNLKKAKEVFGNHENCTYHKRSIFVAENTKAIVSKKSESVINQLNAQRIIDIKENRKKLIPIIETIRFCGKRQIALRCHHDSRQIGLEEPEKNDRNFRSLLRYRANSGDNDLKLQLLKRGGKSMYTSSFIQNELISTFGHLIQSQIVTNVSKSIFYSVLADETTDVS